MDAWPVAVLGHDENGEPFRMIPPVALHQRITTEGVSQKRREDFQIFSFLQTVAVFGGQHDLSVKPGTDPPDRVLESADHTWATELTSLTPEDVRRYLGWARSFARDFEGRLNDNLKGLPHLRGRTVSLSLARTANQKMDRVDEQVVASELEQSLSEDRGTGITSEVDLSDGLPKVGTRVPLKGLYKKAGPFGVRVDAVEEKRGGVAVAAAVQAEFTETQVVNLLLERIRAKDIEQNQILVISCSLPDDHGFYCPVDQQLFNWLMELWREGKLPIPETEHLQAVALHDAVSDEFIEVLRKDGAPVPWRA